MGDACVKSISAIRPGGSLGETLKIRKPNVSPYLKLAGFIIQKKKKRAIRKKIKIIKTFRNVTPIPCTH